ncbi:recombinase family protein [Anaerovorax odorimutans]|uniref:recombinase family protein n=1 Tax=Anaerovorax odorimutans TaxID=109327 RepID=UPI0004227B80|nr:recombinase family protein [Anaerovorax odorimutans]
MQKVAIYCRLSDEDKNKQSDMQDSESIQNQKTMLINYALQNKWEVYDLYSDDDYSGADTGRPEFNRLLCDAENKKFNIVLAKTQSRFTRDMEIVEKYLHNKFIRWGIRFISVVDNADTYNKGNKKSRQINGLVNEWYLEDLSENIKAVLNSKKKQGKYVGAFAPYGYLKNPKDKNKLIIDEVAAENVKTIFKLYIQGYGLTKIAQYLNDKGYPCPSEYKRLNGENYIPRQKGIKGKIWRDTSVSFILNNRMYCGDMVQGKTETVSYKDNRKIRKKPSEWVIIENTHKPIISREIYFKAYDIAKLRTRPENSGKKHIFAGKIKCSECNSVLVKRYGATKDNKYFICPMKKYGVCEKGATISYNLICEAVYSELKQTIKEYVSEDEINNLIVEKNVIDENIKSIQTILSSIEQELKDLNNALENLYIDKVRNIISEEQFSNMSKSFLDKQKKLISQKSVQSSQIKKLIKKNNLKNEKIEVITKFLNLNELSKELIDEFINCIYVKNTEYKGIKEITIKWKL